jgi:hypothetical protein
MKKLLLLLIASSSISLMGMDNQKQIIPISNSSNGTASSPEISPCLRCGDLACACLECPIKTACKIAYCPIKECFNIGRDCVTIAKYCLGTQQQSEPGVFIVHPNAFK